MTSDGFEERKFKTYRDLCRDELRRHEQLQASLAIPVSAMAFTMFGFGLLASNLHFIVPAGCEEDACALNVLHLLAAAVGFGAGLYVFLALGALYRAVRECPVLDGDGKDIEADEDDDDADHTVKAYRQIVRLSDLRKDEEEMRDIFSNVLELNDEDTDKALDTHFVYKLTTQYDRSQRSLFRKNLRIKWHRDKAITHLLCAIGAVLVAYALMAAGINF